MEEIRIIAKNTVENIKKKLQELGKPPLVPKVRKNVMLQRGQSEEDEDVEEEDVEEEEEEAEEEEAEEEEEEEVIAAGGNISTQSQLAQNQDEGEDEEEEEEETIHIYSDENEDDEIVTTMDEQDWYLNFFFTNFNFNY